VKTRVAIVGLGKMGLMHASIMGMFSDVELVAICEKSSLIRRFGGKMIPGVELVENLLDLNQKDLNAILITTPPASHFSIIKSVYEDKIARHIFTEKPLAVSYSQAQELVGLAEKYGGVNMVGYHRRFSVTFNKAKQILESGEIGDTSSFEGHAYSADFLGAKTAAQAKGRGGVIEDSGCHVIDIALWILGDMEVVNARVGSILGPGSEDEACIEVRTLNNIEGTFRASWCKEGYRLPDMCLKIKGTLGTLTVNEDQVQIDYANGKTVIWYKHHLDDNVPFSIGGNEYQRQDQLFIKGVVQGTPVEPGFNTASNVHKLIDQAYKFARGTRV
jgi:predicted dehydrogenase